MFKRFLETVVILLHIIFFSRVYTQTCTSTSSSCCSGSLSLANSVTEIAINAYRLCFIMTSLTIPSTMSSIGMMLNNNSNNDTNNNNYIIISEI